MTLTELRYVVALSQERHFGNAARRCFVTQPTLSLALAKLEEELGLRLFERNKNEVIVTPAGEGIVEQARRVLDEAAKIPAMAKGRRDPLEGALRLGVIPTIGPYLLPSLIPALRRRAPRMPLAIEENFTGNLAPMLREGEIDCAIVALPFVVPGVETRALYEEPFRVVVPEGHPWAKKKRVRGDELVAEDLLVLNAGHCFREQVLEACPGQSNTASPEGRSGSSLETIRNMVASGLGVSVLPAMALEAPFGTTKLVREIAFADPVPSRKVAIAWRASFARPEAVEAVAKAVAESRLAGVKPLAAQGRRSAPGG